MANTRDLVADTMIDAGIEYVFGMPGGSNMFMFDPLFDRQDKIKTVLVRNEQCASGMADMIGRLTGKPAAITAQGAWLASSAGLSSLLATRIIGLPVRRTTSATSQSSDTRPSRASTRNSTASHSANASCA